MLKDASELSMLLKTVLKNNEKPHEAISRRISRISECTSENLEVQTITEGENFENTINNNQYIEKHEIGSVNWNVYAVYFKAVWGMAGLFGIVFLFLLTQALNIAADYWLSNWYNSPRINNLIRHTQFLSNKGLTRNWFFRFARIREISILAQNTTVQTQKNRSIS